MSTSDATVGSTPKSLMTGSIAPSTTSTGKDVDEKAVSQRSVVVNGNIDEADTKDSPVVDDQSSSDECNLMPKTQFLRYDVKGMKGSDEEKGGNESSYLLEYSVKNLSRAKPKIDFLEDDVSEMTFSRRIALSLHDKKWYNPMASTESESESDEEEKDRPPAEDFDEDMVFEKPCLKKGWAFFEHQSLSRYLVTHEDEEERKKNIFVRFFDVIFFSHRKKFDRAEPGEDDDASRLYPIWVPHTQLGDFGLGVGLYFSTMRAFIFVSLICGVLSLYNILYFASEEYDPTRGGYTDEITLFNFYLLGSALCGSQSWVPCPSCDCIDEGESPLDWGRLPPHRCAIAPGRDGTELLFALKNNCDGTPWQLAALNFLSVAFMFASVIYIGIYMKREEVTFDEDEQTAQDYSVQVTNPPGDARDPEEWRRFFKENCDGAQVTVCTCAVHNDLLVNTLVERRELLRTILSKRPGQSMHLLDLAREAAEIERGRNLLGRIIASVVPGLPEHYSRLVALRAKVEGLAQLEYPVTNVFLTFETEEDQRHVLKTLTVGSMKTGPVDGKGDVNAVPDPKYLFRGNHVLNVREPEEPNTIRWQNLNTSSIQRAKELSWTTLLTLALMVVVAFAIYKINLINGVWCAYAITFFGILFPPLAKLMTSALETHPSESSKQASLYFKIVLFRWVTTAFILFIVTPFVDTLKFGATQIGGNNGILPAVCYLFISDMTLTNAISLFDPAGHIQRHFLAPRAQTQDSMNILFKGTPYELAERYTDMTKILMLCLFYCSIFPASFWLCFLSLSIKYQVDKFSLLRTWHRAPHLGPTISKSSRRWFFSITVAIMAIMSSYYWAGFPFDNVCPIEDSSVAANYIGTFQLQPYSSKYADPSHSEVDDFEQVTVNIGDGYYQFCNQDFLNSNPYVSFPFVPQISNPHLDPREYMTADQLISTTYFGWSAFVILLLIIGKYCFAWYKSYEKLTHSTYKAVGEPQGTNYSDCTSRSAYIPQVTSRLFAFPLIACKVDDIDPELFDFTDPDRTFKYYDLTVDAKKLLASLDVGDPPGFTVVKNWPPTKND